MMNRLLLLVVVGLMALALPAQALARVQVRINLGLPVVLPPMVEVQPGIRVIQDYDEEIFFANGYYWVRRDGNWYRARNHRSTWFYVRRNRVPRSLVSFQPGSYRNYRHDERREWNNRAQPVSRNSNQNRREQRSRRSRH